MTRSEGYAALDRLAVIEKPEENAVRRRDGALLLTVMFLLAAVGSTLLIGLLVLGGVE